MYTFLIIIPNVLLLSLMTIPPLISSIIELIGSI
jgi:hypothetical protein